MNDPRPPRRWGHLAALALQLLACDVPHSVAQRDGSGGSASACEPPPAPRWVLRDRDGAPVSATVEPRCGQEGNAESWTRCLPLDFASPNAFPCARVIDFEGRHVNVLYDLASGQIGPCQGGVYSDITKDWDEVGLDLYTNAQCAGDRYAQVYLGYGYYEPRFTRSREVHFVAGQMWYVAEDGFLPASQAWYHDMDTQECIDLVAPQSLGRLVPVPSWVAELLPNPPYSMRVEYE